jgi:hypothetical protein
VICHACVCMCVYAFVRTYHYHADCDTHMHKHAHKNTYIIHRRTHKCKNTCIKGIKLLHMHTLPTNNMLTVILVSKIVHEESSLRSSSSDVLRALLGGGALYLYMCVCMCVCVCVCMRPLHACVYVCMYSVCM